MHYVLIRHTVVDYAQWKPLFDQHAGTRKANGCLGGQLFRTANDPNELLILFQWDDLDKARQFTRSSDLREIMQKAGVMGQPEVSFLETIEEIPV